MIALILQNRYRRQGVRWDNCYTHGMLHPIIEAMGGETAYVRLQADPHVYDHPTPAFSIDAEALQAQVRELAPEYVLACGKAAHQAIAGMDEFPTLCIPHPAWRGFSADMQDRVAAAVSARETGWLFCRNRES